MDSQLALTTCIVAQGGGGWVGGGADCSDRANYLKQDTGL